ncbi:MAG TPA: hypothetical protein VE173_13390 [Longimicrobiales bacterium]|nr:hypothetical protein [Longimicrobiales bacterium]
MVPGRETSAPRDGWTIDRAEALLGSLTGVLSVRIVAKPGGAIEEIHVLTSSEVSPKQTVRNVESALLAHFDLEVDHRKISVAQTSELESARLRAPTLEPPLRDEGERGERGREAPALVQPLPGGAENRILFHGHHVEAERAQRVRMRVAVEWKGERFTGDAEGPDLPRPRLEAVANAALRAVESAVRPRLGERQQEGFGLTLDGVEQIDAFGRRYVLVAVHALNGLNVTALAGASAVGDSQDRAVILAVLQATDRWVRGRI